MLLEDLAQEFAKAARAANLRLEVVPAPLGTCFTGDEYLIKESLRRLIDNALRYRRPESRRVRLSVITLAPYVGLCVEDDGYGMHQSTLAEISQPFELAGRDEHTSSGAGLSLALVKHIVRMHGGQVQMESTYGQGSTVIIWLPAAAPADAA